MSPLVSKVHVQWYLLWRRNQELSKRYEAAALELRQALLARDRAAKWRAASLACDAEHELIGDCAGPCGRIHDRLGIHDCYEVSERAVDLCAARDLAVEFCREGCALSRRKKTASEPLSLP
jgi:hypothetical protein